MHEFAIPEPYVFSDDFSVGNEEIDTQHKGLFEGIDALCKNPGDKCILDKVIAAVDAHFKSEEEKMVAAGCLSVEHKAKHDGLLGIAGGLSVPLSEKDQGFLKNWLVKHIKATDIPQYKGKLNQRA